MHKKMIALLGASLMLALAFLACRFPGAGGGTPTAGFSTPAVPIPTGEPVDPSVPTNTDGAETTVIPGGTFWMGSAEDDTVADDDENPRHQVTLGTFPIYTHEVTQEMYARCVEAGACNPIQVLEGGPTSHIDDPAFAEHPVVGVDWNMARDYCAWAGARLPTEAEWEYAARGADSLLYPWGPEEPACDRLNMGGCLTPPDTAKVGSYARGNSPFGVWDMAGNVWEWTHDWYDPDYYALSPAASPLGPNLPEDPENPQKVARGGGMNSELAAVRSASRIGARPLRSYDDVGFRCVAQPALDLPADYAGTPEGHEWVPPDSLDGGGESVEDPDGWPFASMGGSFASCPDAEGRMRVVIEAATSEPGDWSVTVEDLPYDCSYDDAAHILTCDGSVPAATEFPGEYHVRIYFPGGGLIGHQYPDIPADCPVDWVPPLDLSATADCPAGGWVTVIFRYEPAMRLHTVELTDGTEVMSWPLGDNQTNAIVPARPPGEWYIFHVQGTDDAGREYAAWPVVTIPADCGPEQKVVEVMPVCYLGHPSIGISTMPDTMLLRSASIGGAPLACIMTALGHHVCGDLTDPAGSAVAVNLCFDDDPCYDETVIVPGCPGTAEFFTYEITPACYESLGPVVAIEYTPGDELLVAANANGFDLTCVDAPTPGLYMCYTLPGAAGSTMTITFCLEGGVCHSQDVVVSDCEVETPPDGGFTLAGTGCHDESDIFFIVDTGLGWLVPGAGFTYSAWDGETGYACSAHPTIPGRLYCSGDRPHAPGALDVCVQQDGAPPPPICGLFEDWPAQEDSIPDCAPTIPGVPPCSTYTSEATCPLDRCTWDPKGFCWPR